MLSVGDVYQALFTRCKYKLRAITGTKNNRILHFDPVEKVYKWKNSKGKMQESEMLSFKIKEQNFKTINFKLCKNNQH